MSHPGRIDYFIPYSANNMKFPSAESGFHMTKRIQVHQLGIRVRACVGTPARITSGIGGFISHGADKLIIPFDRIRDEASGASSKVPGESSEVDQRSVEHRESKQDGLSKKEEDTKEASQEDLHVRGSAPRSLKPAKAEPKEADSEPNEAVPASLEDLRPRLKVWKAISCGLFRGF